MVNKVKPIRSTLVCTPSIDSEVIEHALELVAVLELALILTTCAELGGAIVTLDFVAPSFKLLLDGVGPGAIDRVDKGGCCVTRRGCC